jgi:Secretion system C-terminal sorting domain
MKTLYYLLASILPVCVQAQNISSAVISAGGSQSFASTLSVSATIGQPVAGNLLQTNITLQQGFQINTMQGNLTTGLSKEELVLKVYPNPVSERLLIEGDEKLLSADIELTDLYGKVFQIPQIKTKYALELTVASLPPALYVLLIRKENKIIHSLFIIKTN